MDNKNVFVAGNYDVIVVGAGRIGQALMQYGNFENNVNIVMGFDSDL